MLFRFKIPQQPIFLTWNRSCNEFIGSLSLNCIMTFGMLFESLKVPWESKEPKGRKVPLLSPKLRADYRANSAKSTVE